MSAKRQNSKKGKQKKKYSLPQQWPNQSMKSTEGIEPPPMYIITQRNRLLRKLLWSLWSNISLLSKHFLFISFQIVQKNT